MASGDIEIEIKLPLKNAEKVRSFLKENAKVAARNMTQKDTYFNHPSRDFLAPEHPFEWFRIRETKKGASITYKHYRPDNAEVHEYADEFETKLESAEQMHKILLGLGFREMAVVDKVRDTWEFKDTEIAIDDVKGLGQYIEIELMKHFADPREGRKYLFKVLDGIGAKCGPEDVYGYPFRIMEKQGKLGKKR